jgi:cell division GTPase FtsZ
MISVDEFIDEFSNNQEKKQKAKNKIKKIKKDSDKLVVYNNEETYDDQDGLYTAIFLFDELDLI